MYNFDTTFCVVYIYQLITLVKKFLHLTIRKENTEGLL